MVRPPYNKRSRVNQPKTRRAALIGHPTICCKILSSLKTFCKAFFQTFVLGSEACNSISLLLAKYRSEMIKWKYFISKSDLKYPKVIVENVRIHRRFQKLGFDTESSEKIKCMVVGLTGWLNLTYRFLPCSIVVLGYQIFYVFLVNLQSYLIPWLAIHHLLNLWFEKSKLILLNKGDK